MLSLLLGRQKKRLDDNPVLSTLDYWPSRGSRMTNAGTVVDEATSLTYSAVFCATRLLTESVASLPMKLMKRSAKGTPSDAVDMPQYRLTSCQPNPEMPIDVWKIGRTMHQINGGNGFAEIERERFNDPESPPVALWPIEASRVRPVTYRDTDRRGSQLSSDFKYVVRNNDGSSISLKAFEMLHYPGCLSDDGIWGKSIVAHARQDIGTGIAMSRHAGTTFGSGHAPPAIVYGAAMRDPEERDAFRREWKQIHGSADSGDIALLPLDAKYQQIGMRNDEGQYLECVVPETLVLLADGTQKRCDQLCMSDVVVGFDVEKGRLVPSEIEQIADNGVHDLIKITTHRGRELITTRNHPYFAAKAGHSPKTYRLEPGWILAEALTVGDYVKAGLGYQPEEAVSIEAGEAWFIGMMIGDGCTVSNRHFASFTNFDEGIIEKARSFADSRGMTMKKVTSRKTRGAYYFAGKDPQARGQSGGISLARQAMKPYGLIGKAAHEKVVPERIQKATSEAKAAFLAGIWDTDGTISKPEAKQPRICVANTSKKLLDGIRDVLASLGIQSAIYIQNEACEKMVCGAMSKARKCWQLMVCGKSQAKKFAEIIGPHLSHEEKIRRSQHFLTADLGKEEHEDFFEFDRIVKIEEIAPGRTIRLTIKGTHSHVTNGIVTHNSRAFGTHDIARFWRVPVHHLMEMMAGAGYNSLIAITEEFVRLSLMTWLMLQEGQCNQKLLTPEERLDGYYFAHDLSALLKADVETRAKIMEIYLRCGHWSLNDSFRSEGLPTGGPEFDEHYVPLEMTTAERIHKGLPPPAAMKAGDTGSAKTGMTAPAPQKTMKVMPTDQKILAVDDIRQEFDFDCGCACVLAVASFFGRAGGTTEEELIAELGTTETDGTQPEAMIDWLTDAGLVVTSGRGMSVDDLLGFFRKGWPVICPMQLWGMTPDYDSEEQENERGHYIVVVGVGMGQVIYQDPVDGLEMLSEKDFLERWHDMEADGEIDIRLGIAVGDYFDTEEEQNEGEQEPQPVKKAKPPGLPAPAEASGSQQASQLPLAAANERKTALSLPAAPERPGLSGDALYAAVRASLKGQPAQPPAPASSQQGSGRNAAAMASVAKGLGKLAKAVSKQKPPRVRVTPQISVAPANVEVQPANIVVENHLPPLQVQNNLPEIMVHNSLPAMQVQNNMPALTAEISLPPLHVHNVLPEMKTEVNLPPLQVQNTLPPMRIQNNMPALVVQNTLPEMKPEINLPPLKVTNTLPEMVVQNTVNLPAMKVQNTLPEMQPHFHVDAAEPAPAPQVTVENQVDVHVQPPPKVVESVKDVTERDEDGNIKTVRETFEYEEEGE